MRSIPPALLDTASVAAAGGAGRALLKALAWRLDEFPTGSMQPRRDRPDPDEGALIKPLNLQQIKFGFGVPEDPTR